ncbi:MAG: hypothetical protein WC637_00610 [Victivallales bacterium]
MKMMTTVAARPWNEPMVIGNLVKMCEDSATTDVAVMYMCHPEGLPLMKKIEESAEQFRRIKAQLKPHGVRAGIMIQTLLDHGERFQPLSPISFQRITGFDGTVSRACFCPLDNGFLDYVREMMIMFSKESPDFFLVDDDVRLDNHAPARWACACPLHVDLFNRFAGSKDRREQIFEAMGRDDELGLSVRRQWQDSGDESLLVLSRTIREAIDQVDPEISCGKCTSSGISTFRTSEIARALAGRTKPFIRLAGAYYCADGYAYFADVMTNLAAQASMLDKDIELLSESDTCLHTRYHTPVKTLRGHVAGSILAAGIDTPYTWIPGILEWIPEDVKAFSKTMKTGLPFFSELKKINGNVRWLGPTLVMNDRRRIAMPWRESNTESCPVGSWGGTVCGKFGIPFTVNNPDASIYMLDGTSVYDLTREEIENILGKAVLLDGPAAMTLSQWGYSELMGVEVREGDDELRYDYEKFSDDAQLNGNSAGKHHYALRNVAGGAKRLVPSNKTVRVASSFMATRWYNSREEQNVSPAISVFENRRGGRVAVYAQDNMIAASGLKCFMSDTRKEQFLHILSWLGGQKLSAFAWNGVDTYLLYGHDASTGERIASIFNLSQDDVESPRMFFDFGKPDNIRYLTDEGEWKPIVFRYTNGATILDITLRTMAPLVLRIVV